MARTYVYGATVRFAVEFSTAAGVLSTPTSITLTLQNPAGTETPYADATNDSTGKYHRDVQLNSSGIWYWRWVGTGTIPAVDEGTLTVLPSVF